MGNDGKASGGLQLAVVQFVFTLGWTAYALMLPNLLAKAGIAASWLPLILMVDQLIFAVMDIAFGAMADRMRDVFHRLARLLLVLTTVSALAFMALPLAAGVSAGLAGVGLGGPCANPGATDQTGQSGAAAGVSDLVYGRDGLGHGAIAIPRAVAA